jgi:hypothetical protein
MGLTNRSYTAGKFAFELDGRRCGFLQSFEGGEMGAELAVHKMGPANFEKKNATTIKWTPIKMKTGIGMSKSVYQWLQGAFEMDVGYKDGAVTVADFNYKAQRRVDIFGMLMTKVTMPTLDGQSKETAYFDIEAVPETCRWSKESGADLRGEIGPSQKGWQCANWRLDTGGALPAKRVGKIEGIAWECKTAMDSCGDGRENTIHPVCTTVTDWTAHISMADLEPWQAKAKQWFVDGHCLEGNEMGFAISMMDPTFSKELGRIELMNVGFKEFKAMGKLEAQTENVARFQVKFYTEQMKFILNETDA